MMNEEDSLFIRYWGTVIILLIIFGLAMYLGARSGQEEGFKAGYIRSLVDAKNGVSPQYRLVEQQNGESKWEKIEK